MKSTLQPVRMIDFISDLYARFKVLNKLSEKESLDFQREVVTILVDPYQNVDAASFGSLVQPQGVQSFVLEMLAKVMSRSPFKNQFELNRNLATITQNIKKEQEEIQKKQKILQRKEDRLKGVEQGLLASIKQKMQSFQNESILKIAKKENELKRNITQLLNQLKAKEKLILERYEQSKNNANILLQIGQKEKSINDKLKVIEKKEKQLKSKDNQSEGVKRQSEIQQCKDQIQKLRQNLRQATKRYKNLEMAYKKMKNEKTKPESSQKLEAIPKASLNNNVIDLDQLQLSGIHQAESNNNEQFITYIHLQEANGKLESLKNVLTNPQSKDDALKLKQVKQLLNIRQEIIQLSQSQSEGEEQQPSQDYMPACLEPIPEPTNTNDIISKLKDIDLQQEKAKLKFINEGALLNYINQCYKLNTPQQFCEALLEKILQLIEESDCYMEIIAFLASSKVVQFLQHVYLSHETIADIIETVTLILSRIKLKDFQLQLSHQFVKALQIRLKVEAKGSFLYGNVHFILN